MPPTAAAARDRISQPALASRIDRIDILRGLSILAVIFHHINLRIRIELTPLGQRLPNSVANDLGWNGYNGVIIFFAISGFLITTTCLRRWNSLDRISVRKFYRIRFARIAPLLLALLTVLAALHVLRVPSYTIDAHRSTLGRALLAALTFHLNWLEARHGYLPANWDVLWSLSVEEMFYLFFPLLCSLVKRRSALVSIFIAFVLVGPFARTVFTQNEYWADNGYLSCTDAIALGCLAALFADRVLLKANARMALQSVGISLMVFITLFRSQVGQIGIYKVGLDVSLLALGTALACIAFLQANVPGSRFSAPLRWFGRNCYEVYLTHVMVIFAMLPLIYRYDAGYRWAPLWYALMAALAGTLGWLIMRYYSEPMNRRLRKQTTQPLPEPATA
jgi:peptidoglycan/LPS O-acetylase OafA/YrhL